MQSMTSYSMDNLFAQLGLPNTDDEIDQFVESHQLADDLPLYDAPFWSEGQRQFIRQSLRLDSMWTEVVDELSMMLHS